MPGIPAPTMRVTRDETPSCGTEAFDSVESMYILSSRASFRMDNLYGASDSLRFPHGGIHKGNRVDTPFSRCYSDTIAVYEWELEK